MFMEVSEGLTFYDGSGQRRRKAIKERLEKLLFDVVSSDFVHHVVIK